MNSQDSSSHTLDPYLNTFPERNIFPQGEQELFKLLQVDNESFVVSLSKIQERLRHCARMCQQVEKRLENRNGLSSKRLSQQLNKLKYRDSMPIKISDLNDIVALPLNSQSLMPRKYNPGALTLQIETMCLETTAYLQKKQKDMINEVMMELDKQQNSVNQARIRRQEQIRQLLNTIVNAEDNWLHDMSQVAIQGEQHKKELIQLIDNKIAQCSEQMDSHLPKG